MVVWGQGGGLAMRGDSDGGLDIPTPMIEGLAGAA